MMDYYSQHNLKIAATEPEHIVRKAEFDAAIDELRITLKCPIGVGGSMPSASIREIPQFTDAVTATLPEIQNMGTTENFTFKGRIVAAIENSSGEVLQQAESTNAVTEAFLRYALANMFQNHYSNSSSSDSMSQFTDLRRIVRIGRYNGGYSYYGDEATLSNWLRAGQPFNHGIYCMSHPVVIDSGTFYPPYVSQLNRAALGSNVTFYNKNGSKTEDTKTLVPNDVRSYWDIDTNEFVVEYLKNTGSGDIRSVAIGRAHDVPNEWWDIGIIPPSPAPEWKSGEAANWWIENTTTDSYFWIRRNSPNKRIVRINSLTKEVEVFQTDFGYDNMGTSTNQRNKGIVVGENLYRVIKQGTPNASGYVVRIEYTNNFKAAAGTANDYKEFTFTLKNGATAAETTTFPVLIHRPHNNTLEVFVTTSSTGHTSGPGCNLQKATIDLADFSAAPTFTDYGVIPYAVSTQAAHSCYGFYVNGKYRLPYTFTYDGTAKITTGAANNESMIETADFATFVNVTPAILGASSWNPVLFHIWDGSKMRHLMLNHVDHPWMFMSQLVSGTNLNQTLTKTENTIFRLQYRYRLI